MTYPHVLVDAAQRAAVDLAEAQRALASAKTRDQAAAATAAVAAATAALHAARAVVSRALAFGRLASAAHVLDLPHDTLGDVFGRLPPRDVAAAAAACRALRDAVRQVNPYRAAVAFPAMPIAQDVAATLTSLTLRMSTPENMLPPLPFLPRLVTLTVHAFRCTTDEEVGNSRAVNCSQPRLICADIAPALSTFVLHEPNLAPSLGATSLWTSLAGITRVVLSTDLTISFNDGEKQFYGLYAVLTSLRRLDFAAARHVAWLDMLDMRADAGRRPALTLADVSTRLPPMPAVTRLGFHGGARIAPPGPESQLPAGLQVLDLRGLTAPIMTDEVFNVGDNEFRLALGTALTGDPPTELRTPFVLPPIAAALMPALHTLLVGFAGPPGAFNLWDLVRAPSALRVVVIENSRLRCQPPPDTPVTTVIDRLRTHAPLLASVHVHGCITGGSTADAARQCYTALKQHAPRFCAVGAGDKTCLVCSLIDAE